MTKRANGKVTVAIYADTHVNSTVGLLSEKGIDLDDGQPVGQSSGQQFLWRSWIDFVAFAKEKAAGGKFISVGAGDLCDADEKDRTTQIITRNRKKILDMMVDAHAPLVDAADDNYILRGTEVHTGKSGELESKYADDIGAIGNIAHWYLPLDAAGVLIEIAHHAGPGGRKPWTVGGSMISLAAETIVDYAGHHERVPDLVIRAHVHRWSDSGDNVPGCRALTIGAFTLAGAHVHRMGAGMRLADIGGVVIVCQNRGILSQAEVYKFKRCPQRTPTIQA